MEPTDDHMLETVTLDLRPVLDLVGGDILGIAGHIIRGKGVRALSPDGSHQLVVLIGDEILGSHLTHRVDLVIRLLALIRVCQQTIPLIAVFDVLQQRRLSLRIGRTEMRRTLKHQVLQVMRQTSRLRRVILRSRPDGNIRLNPRLLIVHREINLQTIIEGIDARLRHIPFHGLIFIIFRLHTNA